MPKVKLEMPRLKDLGKIGECEFDFPGVGLPELGTRWDSPLSELSANVMLALCVRGFGCEKCPSIGEWASFAVITGVAGTITGDEIFIDGEDFHITFNGEIYYAMFQVMKSAKKLNLKKKILDPALVELALYLAQPVVHSGDGYLCDGHTDNNFCCKWKWLNINPVANRSVYCVDVDARKNCDQIFPALSPELQQSIDCCVPAIRSQTEYTCQYVKRRYHW